MLSPTFQIRMHQPNGEYEFSIFYTRVSTCECFEHGDDGIESHLLMLDYKL